MAGCPDEGLKIPDDVTLTPAEATLRNDEMVAVKVDSEWNVKG